MNPIIHLVKKAQKGDDQAFLMIFQHYQEDLYRMAYVYVKNQEEALDVIQEVAYQSFKSINSTVPLTPSTKRKKSFHSKHNMRNT
ncbi:hypothetical protein UACE39S_06032 [Ureibacillus acetophenoni]